ncbi:MAG: penicillin-binding protein 2 [Hyphomicrobiales bacterium]
MTATAAQATPKPAANLRGQKRLRLIMGCFLVAFAAITAKLGYISLIDRGPPSTPVAADDFKIPRPDIVDRNGEVLATDIQVASLYAEPNKIIDIDEAVEQLTANVQGLDATTLRRKLSMDRGFIWLKRQVSPDEQQRVHDLGIPGVGFRTEPLRVYPKGRLASHILGYVDVDSRGLAGIEKYLDDKGAIYAASLADPATRSAYPAQLSIDVRVQHAVEEEVQKAIVKYKAKAGGGVVLDANTGEVVALASFPDFNPNQPIDAQKPDHGNRMSGLVFELGSVVKAVTFAMALDAGVCNLQSSYDARYPLIVGRARISDYHAQRRVLTVPEIFMYSSNIGTAKMALDVGLEGHQAFLRKVGFMDRLRTELPEAARPLLPHRWSKISTVTAAFGHGIAVQPLQGASVTAALLNGGKLIPPTLLKRDQQTADELAVQVIKPQTSEMMRYLFRLNVEKGTATKTDIPGFLIGGKTGTAEKVVAGRYVKNRLLTSFIGAFPMDHPRYVVLIMLDEPQPLPETYGFATAGWNAVPTASKVLARLAAIFDLEPHLTEADIEKLTKAENKKQAAAVLDDN